MKQAHFFHRLSGLLTPEMRYRLRRALDWLRRTSALLQLWQWRWQTLLPASCSFEYRYLGRAGEAALAGELLGLATRPPVGEAPPAEGGPVSILISEAPLPGALRIPRCLHTPIALDRPVADILAGYGATRRFLRKQKDLCEMRQITDDAEIERLYHTMIVCYGEARHPGRAVHPPLDEVRHLAKVSGRLDLIFNNGEELGCHLAYGLVRGGKRYWVTLRFGYPPPVIADLKRLSEANSINAYLAMAWASENGYDYHDLGRCLARPDDGLLQWKRRRGSAVDTLMNDGWFHVRLPARGQAQFLWDGPLFSCTWGALHLHLGVPPEKTREDIQLRYREMGFGGLAAIHVYCEPAVAELALEEIRALYHNRTPIPRIAVRHPR